MYLSYFYAMQQLDLFGFPIETPAPKKKEKAARASDVQPAEAETKTAGEKEGTVIASTPIVDQPKEEKIAEAPQEIIPVAAIEATPADVVLSEEKAADIAEAKIIAPPVVEEAPVVKTVAKEKTAAKKTTTAAAKPAGKRGRKSFKEMDNEADLIEVPDDEVLQQKLYYSISEVAGWFKVNTSLLRYWENEFDVLQPRKTRKGDRLFRVEDIKNLQLIYFLLRQRKFSIDGAKNYLKNNKQEADTQIRLVESLTRFRSFLLEMKANLQA